MTLFHRLFIQPFTPRPRAKTLANFYHQFAAMLTAGLSPVQSLDTLAEQGGWGLLGRRFAPMKQHVLDGGRIADAFARFPESFDPLHVAIIRAAEQAGRVGDALERLALLSRRRAAIAAKLATSLLYPFLLLNFAFLVGPLIQHVRKTDSSYLELLIPTLALFYGAVLLFFAVPRILRQFTPAAYLLDSLKEFVPVAAGLAEKLALARFARALEGLTESGLGLNESLDLAARTCGNEVVRRRLESLAPALERGERLSAAMKSDGDFPPLLVNLIATGEQSGHIATMLGNAAALYEDEAETTLGRLTVILPIIASLAVSIYVGYQIIQAYSSLWSGSGL